MVNYGDKTPIEYEENCIAYWRMILHYHKLRVKNAEDSIARHEANIVKLQDKTLQKSEK